MTAKREEVVDFTQPYYDTALRITVAKHSIFDWWRLLRSLISPGFWVALLGLLGITVLVGVIVWLLERRANEVFGRNPKVGISQSVWWSASTMAQASTEPRPATVGGLIVALLWMGAFTSDTPTPATSWGSIGGLLPGNADSFVQIGVSITPG